MSIDTRISTYLVPAQIWEHGANARPDLPALALPARDALDIERRAAKGVNVKNELRRHVLCCERIQQIVAELSLLDGVLDRAMVWLPRRLAGGPACAEAFLTVQHVFGAGLRDRVRGNLRAGALFVTPRDTGYYDTLRQLPEKPAALQSLLDTAVQRAAVRTGLPPITLANVHAVFEARLRIAQTARERGAGIVDVVELV